MIVGQTDHGVGLWQVSAESGTLGRLDRSTNMQSRFDWQPLMVFRRHVKNVAYH